MNITAELIHARLAEMQSRWEKQKAPAGRIASTGSSKKAKNFDENAWERVGVLARYRRMSFEAIEEQGVPEELQNKVQQVKDYADSLEKHLSEGTGLILRGPTGTLKTSLAVAVIQTCLTSGHEARFLTAAALVDSFFSARNMPPDEWAALDAKLRRTPLLVIDDLGSEWSEGWIMTRLDSFFAERYNRKRSIIITTNLGTDQMRSRYTERIIDRLRATCRIITFNFPRSLRESCGSTCV